jgi:nitrate reductase gamma subunit
MNRLLWGVYPYVCVTLFLVVPVVRMVFRPFGYSTRASSLFARGSLGLASTLMHWGLLLVLTGHLFGLFGGVLGHEQSIRVFFWIGLVGGVSLLLGSTLALFRRFTVPEVRAMSQSDDYVVHLFMITIVSLALYQVLAHKIFGVAYTASAWAASLWTLSPQPELMASASFISKLHVFIALTFFAYFPFTKLVHAWTYPINYFVRPIQSMRTVRFRFQRKWEFGLRSDKSWLVYGLGTAAGIFVGAGHLLGHGAHAQVTTSVDGVLTGMPLYISQCARCHGVTGHGDGAGASSPTFARPPRDLTAAQYRFVSTENSIASRDDLAHTIRHGLPVAGMPAFDQLTTAQIDSLVSVLEGFWVNRPAPGAAIKVPPRPQQSDAMVARGQALFAQNCVACHGAAGRGDGPAGVALKAANLAAGALKAGHEPEQIYFRIAAGIPAASMPAFRASMSTDDIWSVVTYLEHDILPKSQ